MKNIERNNIDRLAEALFEGPVKAADFKVMPGSKEDLSTDHLAGALLESLARMGLVVNGKLVNKNG